VLYLKKVTAILFFTFYVFSTTEAQQLLKLPVIFQHFQEHKKEDKNISLLRFLAIHYLHGSPKDKDYDRDMQLPFKTSGDCLSSITPAFVSSISEFSIAKPVEIFQKERNIFQDGFTLSSFLSGIWQPPKSC
jgi:hypothetical protein